MLNGKHHEEDEENDEDDLLELNTMKYMGRDETF